MQWATLASGGASASSRSLIGVNFRRCATTTSQAPGGKQGLAATDCSTLKSRSFTTCIQPCHWARIALAARAGIATKSSPRMTNTSLTALVATSSISAGALIASSQAAQAPARLFLSKTDDQQDLRLITYVTDFWKNLARATPPSP